MSSSNGRLFTTQGENFRMESAKNCEKLVQVGVVQIPAKKKGKKARVTMASDRSWKR